MCIVRNKPVKSAVGCAFLILLRAPVTESSHKISVKTLGRKSFQDTLAGKVVSWYFKYFMKQVYNHTFSPSDDYWKVQLYLWSSKNFTNLESESHPVVSNSLQPHGPYSPWNSPGQNIGEGSLSVSRASSQPRDWTQVSHIAGRFFTSWATREAQESWSGSGPLL